MPSSVAWHANTCTVWHVGWQSGCDGEEYDRVDFCSGGEGCREREVLRGGVAVDVIVPLGMGPLLEILKVFGKDTGVGEDLGDIVEHRCIAV